MAATSALFKRLKLIDEQELNRLVEKQLREYDPTIRSLATLHREMQEIEGRSDLTPEEKVALLSATQQRFSQLKFPKGRGDPRA